MFNRAQLFTAVRLALFGGALTTPQVDGITAILDTWELPQWCKCDLRWLAYMYGTAYHETDRTMQPIHEYKGWESRPYGKHVDAHGKPYTETTNLFPGRGLVQLTWIDNYRKARDKLGVDFVQHPELAMEMQHAVSIMFLGMTEGWFTGAKLGLYFNDVTEDWFNARRIINGVDRAGLVATYARQYYTALLGALLPEFKDVRAGFATTAGQKPPLNP